MYAVLFYGTGHVAEILVMFPMLAVISSTLMTKILFIRISSLTPVRMLSTRPVVLRVDLCT